MQLVKLGDRGGAVRQIQEALNARPSKLVRLTADGVFGIKTQARVMEFQRDNGLKADGIVGDVTRSRLNQVSGPGGAATLIALVNQLQSNFNFAQRASFSSSVRPLVGPPVLANPAVLAGPALEALIILIILSAMAVLLINSQSKANQEAGRALQRQINSLRDKLLSEPAQAAAVAATALVTANEAAKKLAEQARSEREKCLENMIPQLRAKKLVECAQKLKDVSTAIQSLLQKTLTPTGGGITEETLIKGINVSSAALIAALRALGECTGCDNLFI